jgi:3-keto-L-gulonate-6-phosphate decarboxylase
VYSNSPFPIKLEENIEEEIDAILVAAKLLGYNVEIEYLDLMGVARIYHRIRSVADVGDKYIHYRLDIDVDKAGKIERTRLFNYHEKICDSDTLNSNSFLWPVRELNRRIIEE